MTMYVMVSGSLRAHRRASNSAGERRGQSLRSERLETQGWIRTKVCKIPRKLRPRARTFTIYFMMMQLAGPAISQWETQRLRESVTCLPVPQLVSSRAGLQYHLLDSKRHTPPPPSSEGFSLSGSNKACCAQRKMPDLRGNREEHIWSTAEEENKG